jgi:alkaline phosphatase D
MKNLFFKSNLILVILLLFSFTSFGQKSVTKIAFGSCGHQNHPLPIFDVVVKHNPDLFIFLGDNIYGDTKNMDTLRAKYQKLAIKPSYQNLKNNTRILATWDDHDYGWNDAGRHYPYKDESKEIFLDFFEEPKDSPRRNHKGIYTSYMFENKGKKLQIILLDNRTFRDDLRKYNGEPLDKRKYFYKLDYFPHENSDSTLLGEEQWAWLEKELEKPADIRLIGSGTQFSIEYNSYEAWVNFPHEQKRFLDLIKKTKANGIVFLTGDVHYAEISKLEVPGLYPIYDFTSSGLSSKWHFSTPNANRIEGPVLENHFGLVTIDWKKKIPSIKMEVFDDTNNQRVEYTINLDQISFK